VNTISESVIIDGNVALEFVAFNVADMVMGSVVIVPSDSWGTAVFAVKRSPDGTTVNAQEFSPAKTITSATDPEHDIDLTGIEWLIVVCTTAEGSALRCHVHLDAKGCD